MTNLDFRTIDVRYHQQDEADFCGAAVAQMILAQLGAGILDQGNLQGEAAPIGQTGIEDRQLGKLLESRRPQDGGPPFVVSRDDDPGTGVRRIFAALMITGCAVPASVVDGTHWVAVTGVVFDADATPEDAEIRGFFIHNPEPEHTKNAPPGTNARNAPPHSADDTCGHGHGFGSPNTFVTIHEWLNLYWAPPSRRGGVPYVTIPRGGRDLYGSVRAETTAVPPGKPLEAAALRERAIAGISAYGILLPKSPLAKALADPTYVEPVLQISSMSNIPSLKSSERYYVVQVHGAQGAAAYVRIGASDGRFLSVETPIAFHLLPEDLFDFASGALARYEEKNGALGTWSVTGERSFTVHPTLVWRPCLQSTSPFQPFVQINLAGTIVYVTMDGKVHPELLRHDGTPV